MALMWLVFYWLKLEKVHLCLLFLRPFECTLEELIGNNTVWSHDTGHNADLSCLNIFVTIRLTVVLIMLLIPALHFSPRTHGIGDWLAPQRAHTVFALLRLGLQLKHHFSVVHPLFLGIITVAEVAFCKRLQVFDYVISSERDLMALSKLRAWKEVSLPDRTDNLVIRFLVALL